MNIRLATLDDLQSISNLLTEFFAYNAAQQPANYVSVTENGEYPCAVISGNSGDFIVAEIDNEIVGLVHVEQDATPPYPSVKPHKYACIVDFIVKEQYRRKKIGHLLLEKVESWAQSRNLEYIELMVLEKNQIGQNFYEREQFITISRTMRLSIS